MTDAEKIALMDKLAAGFNAHDADALMDCMSDDCVFYGAAGPSAHGGVFEGPAAVWAAYAAVWEKYPDARWNNLTHFVSGNKGVSQWLFTGATADGKEKCEVYGCDIFEFKGDKIRIKDSYRKQRL